MRRPIIIVGKSGSGDDGKHSDTRVERKRLGRRRGLDGLAIRHSKRYALACSVVAGVRDAATAAIRILTPPTRQLPPSITINIGLGPIIL